MQAARGEIGVLDKSDPARARPGAVLLVFALLLGPGGCATSRVTDPQRTATEQYLMSQAASEAVEKLSSIALRDRRVYVDSSFLTQVEQPSLEHTYLLGELRSLLLRSGVRLTQFRHEADIVLEVRSGVVGVDRLEFLIGIPAIYVSGLAGSTAANVPLSTPELAIVKSTKQYGFAEVAFVAYWRDTGELVASSGPFTGRTRREDFWVFGFGPRTVGDIPPAQPPPRPTTMSATQTTPASTQPK